MERVHFLDQPQATEHDRNGLGSHRIRGGGEGRGGLTWTNRWANKRRIWPVSFAGLGRPGAQPEPISMPAPAVLHLASSSSSILCPFYFACAHSAKPCGPSYVRSAVVSFHRWFERGGNGPSLTEPLVSIYRKVSSILTGSTRPIRPAQSTRPGYFN